MVTVRTQLNQTLFSLKNLEGNPEAIQGPDDLAGKRCARSPTTTPAENIRTNYPDAQLTNSTSTPSANPGAGKPGHGRRPRQPGRPPRRLRRHPPPR